jgi:hypothetical protein
MFMSDPVVGIKCHGQVRSSDVYGVNVRRFGFRTFCVQFGVFFVAVFALALVPTTVAAENRKIEQFGTIFQALLPLAGALCAYRQSDISDYSTRFINPSGQDDILPPPSRNNFRDAGGRNQPEV